MHPVAAPNQSSVWWAQHVHGHYIGAWIVCL